MTDRALLRLWIEKRDQRVFREITQRYTAMIYATCMRLLGNPADAEEVEVFGISTQ